MSLEMGIMKANSGDCIWLRYGDVDKKKNVIIDSGTKSFVVEFKKILDKIETFGEVVDLLIITHSDGDHIGGFEKWLIRKKSNLSMIKLVWMNNGNSIGEKFLHSIRDIKNKSATYRNIKNGDLTINDCLNISEILLDKGIPFESVVHYPMELMIGDGKIQVLSPSILELLDLADEWKINQREIDKKNKVTGKADDNKKNISSFIIDNCMEDDNIFNKTSIAIAFTYKNDIHLFLGDSIPSNVIKGKTELYGIEPLSIKTMKLSHHGSEFNLNYELLKHFKTKKYILSTNGRNGNPSKRVIYRLIKCANGESIEIYSNYKWWVGNWLTDDDIKSFIDTKLLKLIKLDSTKKKIDSKVLISNEL